MEEPYSFFKNIKKARTSSGLSQKELAKRLEVSDKTISAYETGRAIPPMPTLAKIAKITETPISDLLGIDNGKNEGKIAERLKKIEEIIEKQNNPSKAQTRVKIDTFVGIVLINKNKDIYLIKEEDKYRISMGRWNLPGGSVDGNESLTEAAGRETKEETGHNAKIGSLVGCYKCKKGDNSWIYTVFSAKITGDKKTTTDPGVKEGRWFNEEEFMKLDPAKMVHPDMKLVYQISTSNKGLGIKSVKYIDYDKE